MTPQERKKKEKSIKQYLKGNNISKIHYMQVEQTFSDLGHIVNIWNVKTNQGA
jgi:hypothetical protein